ncbi:MAG TPA: hypothetical protein VGM59_07275 [Dongiaceae bacterium]
MTNVTSDPAYPVGGPSAGASRFESVVSGVSWGAIIAGAVGAAAMALILTVLGAGLGLVAVSPWRGEGVSAASVGIGVIIWSLIIHAVAFGLGGYLAGRLRTKWANIHGDEVYFRDTAHGFVTWALGSLVSLALLTSVAGHLAKTTAEVGATAGGAALVGASAAGGMAMQGGGGQEGGMRMHGNPMDYYVDELFRPAGPAPAAGQGGAAAPATTGTTTEGATAGAPAMSMTTPGGNSGGNPGDIGPMRAEINRIVAASFKDGQLTISPADKTYVAGLIAQRAGLSQQDAEKRIDTVVDQAKTAISDAQTKAKQVADDARKAGAGLALWTFVALLLGAFCASFMATIGGRHRDL